MKLPLKGVSTLLSVSFAVCCLLVARAGYAVPVPADKISDTFVLMNGNALVEQLTFKESEEPGFKTFATIFPAGTSVQNGIVTAPGEGSTQVSDTVDVITDPADANNRLIRLFSDGDANAPTPDPGETQSFRVFNFLGNAMPADRVVVYSDTTPVPLPGALWLFGSGVALLITGSRRGRRNHGRPY